MKTEIWKDVVGYEGLYSVSDQGRVKSHWYGNARILAQSTNKLGYLKLTLSNKEGMRNFTIHILVALSHTGTRPSGYDISHKDGCKTNNNASNLEYITHKENITKNRQKVDYLIRHVGVCWSERDKKWASHVRIDGKLKFLGLFNTIFGAHKAYKKEANNMLNY